MQVVQQYSGLTNLQLELLKIFSRQMPDEQLQEIKEMLATYFAGKASDEMDRLWDEKGWTNDTMRQWLAEKKSHTTNS